MITIAKQPIMIEDLGKHTLEDIAELRMLLEAGVVGHPDSHRPHFYELDGSITFSGIWLDKGCC